MAEQQISEERRKARFERWESLGLDRVKHDLLSGGYRDIGGSPQVRELAWDWVKMKEAELAKAAQKPEEVVTLKPGVWGMSVDLKLLWRRFRRRF